MSNLSEDIRKTLHKGFNLIKGVFSQWFCDEFDHVVIVDDFIDISFIVRA